MGDINNLKSFIEKYEKVCVAYSGGVDSDFLLNVCVEILGNENVVAIIANGEMLAKKDLDDAIYLLEAKNVNYHILEVDIFSVLQFANNDKKRCYFCKKAILENIFKKTEQLGFDIIFDGKNKDDITVYRPGAMAAKEYGVISPLAENDFTKEDIRQFAKKMNLETWNKPSNSCLATRFPYDTTLNSEKFEMVYKGELILKQLGIKGGRVRMHGDIARIEVGKQFFNLFTENENVTNKFKAIGFKYVTLDLEGFRSGSMD